MSGLQISIVMSVFNVLTDVAQEGAGPAIRRCPYQLLVQVRTPFAYLAGMVVLALLGTCAATA